MNKRQPIDNEHTSLSPKILADTNQQPEIEFNAYAYAVLEHDQKCVIIIKRNGPVDTDVRFRCLHSLAHSSMHAYAMIQYDTA